MRRVRLGVIGVGMIGKVHAETAAKLPDCELVAVSDVNPATKPVADAIGAKFYPNFLEMIEAEALDGVVAAVPNNLHRHVGVACAEKRLHVLLEKPIASTLDDADQLIDSFHRNQVHLLIGHHRRFNAAINAVRELIQGGKIGTLVGVAIVWSMYKPDEYFEFAWRRQKGGGPILINTIHEIDNLRYMCGNISRVYAETSNAARHFPVEDTVSVSVKLESGALATIFMSDAAPSLWAYEATTGENPFFFHSTQDCYYILGTEASLTFPHLKKIYYQSQRGWQHPLTTEELRIPWADPYEEQLKHFCRVVRGSEAPRTSGEDGRTTLEITLAVSKSAETGQPIMV